MSLLVCVSVDGLRGDHVVISYLSREEQSSFSAPSVTDEGVHLPINLKKLSWFRAETKECKESRFLPFASLWVMW